MRFVQLQWAIFSTYADNVAVDGLRTANKSFHIMERHFPGNVALIWIVCPRLPSCPQILIKGFVTRRWIKRKALLHDVVNTTISQRANQTIIPVHVAGLLDQLVIPRLFAKIPVFRRSQRGNAGAPPNKSALPGRVVVCSNRLKRFCDVPHRHRNVPPTCKNRT